MAPSAGLFYLLPPMLGFFLQILKEIHKHPLFTLLVAVGLISWAAFSFAYFATNLKVDTVEVKVDNVDSKVMSISLDITRTALEQKVRSLESEIFSLQRMVDEKTARDIDYERLSRLKSDLGTAERKLIRLN